MALNYIVQAILGSFVFMAILTAFCVATYLMFKYTIEADTFSVPQ